MKKRTLAFVVAAVACCIALVGGTLAYFTDTDGAANVFTTGNVDIELVEKFEQGAELTPGVKIEKEVTVENTGTMDTYVRVLVAIPSILDSGSEDLPQFAAYNNTLHVNWDGPSAAEGQWSQFASAGEVGPNANYPNWPDNGGAYNMYQETIDGTLYNVYVYTYESVLPAGETTATSAISQVYLDTKVTQEDMATILDELGTIKVLVAVEGCQVETFTDAFDALNTAFGVPGTYTVDWTVA